MRRAVLIVFAIMVVQGTEVLSEGIDEVACVKNVEKTCKDMFGAYAPSGCATTDCYSTDWCPDPCDPAHVNGRPLVIPGMNQNSWDNSTAMQAIGSTKAEGGRMMSVKVNTAMCATIGVCLNPCNYDPISGSKKCQPDLPSQSTQWRFKMTKDEGPCLDPVP